MSGRQSPSFQFYARDWLASSSVRRMTLAERGAYIDLLAYAWQDGGLPDDDAEIARLLQVSLRVWRTLAPRVRSRFQVQDGRLINARLEGVRAEQAAYRERRANSGRSGAAKRWRNSGPDDGTATTEPLIEDSTAIDLPSSLPSSRHSTAIDLPMAKHSSASASASASASERSQIRTGGVISRTEDGADTEESPPALWRRLWEHRWPEGICRTSHAELTELERLVAQFGAVDVTARIGRYLARPDAELVRRMHPLGIFLHQVNEYREQTDPLTAATQAFVEGT